MSEANLDRWLTTQRTCGRTRVELAPPSGQPCLGSWNLADSPGVTSADILDAAQNHAQATAGRIGYLVTAKPADASPLSTDRVVTTVWIEGGATPGRDGIPDLQTLSAPNITTAALARVIIEQSKCLTAVVRDTIGNGQLAKRFEDLMAAERARGGTTEHDVRLRQLELEREEGKGIREAVLAGLGTLGEVAKAGLMAWRSPAQLGAGGAEDPLSSVFSKMSDERAAELQAMLGPKLAPLLFKAKGTPELAEVCYMIGAALFQEGRFDAFVGFFTPAEQIILRAATAPIAERMAAAAKAEAEAKKASASSNGAAS
jgi:hypothetical protein